MLDKIIKINTKTGEAYKQDCYLGARGQNLQNKLIFEMSEKINGVAWLEYEINGAKNYAIMEEIENGYQIDIKSCLLISDTVNVDLRITEYENPLGIPVFVSTICSYKINNSIEATEEEPEYYPSWMEIANQKIIEMDNLDIDISKQGTVATIAKTNKDGTTKSVQVYDGAKGDKGEKGDCFYAIPYIDIETGLMKLEVTDDTDYICFNIDEEGFLEVNFI